MCRAYFSFRRSRGRVGCELWAGQGSLQCTESRTTRSGPWAALDPQRPSAATAFTNLCAPGKPPSREMGASLHFWPGHLRGPPRSLPSLTLLAGVGGREATSQLPPPQNKLTSPAGSLLMGPHSGGRKMDGHCPQSLECLPLPAQVLGPPWPPRHAHGDLTSLAPHVRLPEILVVPREKTPTGAAARGNP